MNEVWWINPSLPRSVPRSTRSLSNSASCKPSDAALAQPEFNEERQQLRDQTGSELKWRAAHARPLRRASGRAGEQHLARGAGQEG